MYVIAACEMVSPELAEYLTDMNIYDRELMVLEHRMNKLFGTLEGRNEKADKN